MKRKGVRKKRINPLGMDGQVLTCMLCGSYLHLLDVCPDSWENMERGDTRVDSHVKPLSLNENKKLKCKEELEGLSFDGGMQFTQGEERNISAGIADLVAELASLKAEIS